MLKSAPPKPASNAARRERRADGSLQCFTGSSRCGKSTAAAIEVVGRPRAIVWDWPKRQWSREFGCKPVDSFRELAKYCVPGAPPARVAFARNSENPAADFDTWARLAWIMVQAHDDVIVIGEELSKVTSPGKAPPGWGMICSMGIGYGADIYAITQRPAESDKTAFGNADRIRCGRFSFPSDRKMLAEYLDVPLQEITALKPLQFIERHAGGDLHRGVVDVKKRKK